MQFFRRIEVSMITKRWSGAKGTKNLTKKYGSKLVAIRYYKDRDTGEKRKTIELDITED